MLFSRVNPHSCVNNLNKLQKIVDPHKIQLKYLIVNIISTEQCRLIRWKHFCLVSVRTSNVFPSNPYRIKNVMTSYSNFDIDFEQTQFVALEKLTLFEAVSRNFNLLKRVQRHTEKRVIYILAGIRKDSVFEKSGSTTVKIE